MMSNSLEEKPASVALGRRKNGSDTAFRSRFLIPAIAGTSIVILLLVGGLTTESFLSYDNVLNIIQIASFTGIIALGTTFVTLSGNFFSLSLSQTGALSSIVFAATLTWGWGVVPSFVSSLVVAAFVGVLQGLLVALGGNPIVVTIAAGAVIFGLAAVATGSRAVIIRGPEADWLGSATPLGIPIQTWTFVVLAFVFQFVLTRSRFGRETILVGSNRSTARAVGLPVGRVGVTVFAISAMAAGLAGIFVAAQSSRGLVSNLEGVNLEVVAAVLVGGTSIQGGEGSMYRTALGAVFIAMLRNLLILRGYEDGVRLLVEGLAVVAGVSIFWIARGGRSR